jgi:hypothetical protein
MIDQSAIADAVAQGHVNAAGWVRVTCPACELRTLKPDRRKSLGVNAESGWYGCFKCGFKGRLDGYSAPLEDALEGADKPEPPTLPDGFVRLADPEVADSRAGAAALAYAHGRGIGDDAIAGAAIGIAIGNAYLRNRIIIPVATAAFRVVGWSARDMSGRAPTKYLYPSGMNRETLFNEAALMAGVGPVMLVEGVFDALPYWPDACASLGKLARGQMDKLRAACRPVVVVYDGDAWQDGRAVAQQLQMFGIPAAWLRLPVGSDPGDADPRWVRAQVMEAARRL